MSSPFIPDRTPITTLPPRYDETIILCQSLDPGEDDTWLWLQNYEDLLFSDGNADRIISLKVGMRKVEELSRFPGKGEKKCYISKYLDVPEIIAFQQKILGARIPQRSTDARSPKEYVLRLIFDTLKAMGVRTITPP